MRGLGSTRVLTVAFCMAYADPADAQPVLLGCTTNSGSVPPTSHIVDIDTLTGAATNRRDTAIATLVGIAVQPTTGNLFGLTSLTSSPANALVRINQYTGQTNLVGLTGLTQVFEGDLAFSPVTGLLYGLQDLGGVGARRLFRIDPATGAGQIVGDLPTSGDYSAMAFNSVGTLFVLDTSGNLPSTLLTVEPDSAMVVLTVATNLDLGTGAGMAIDPISGIAYVADGGPAPAANTLFTLDVLTGTLVPVGSLNTPGGISGLSFASIPEPGSVILIACGAFMGFGLRMMNKFQIAIVAKCRLLRPSDRVIAEELQP